MKAFPLYVRYALRSFVRGRSRSLFGAFCVAVGIASVVALGLVAGNFRDSAMSDARKLNRADVAVSPSGLGFTLKQYNVFADLKARGQISNYTTRLQDNAALRSPARGGGSTVGSIVGVNPKVFPYYDTITADEPKGVALAQLLSIPDSTVVSHDTLDTLNLRVGDRVVVNSQHGFTHTYVIKGVVPDSAINPFFGSGFWDDFAMVSNTTVTPFFHAMDVGATTVYIKTSSAAQAARVKGELAKQLGNLTTIKTVADVAKDQRNSAAAFDTFFRIMGLVAVVIGGIGIINTMLVAARRRIKEVAVLKTLGMKGRQVVLVFVIESLILAVSGTALGILGGIGASALVNKATENLSGNPIPWTIHAGPIVAGVLVGVVATVLFAYMPILGASRARPVAALRGDLQTMLKTGWFRRLIRNMRAYPFGTVGRGVRGVPMGVVRLPKRQGFRSFVLVVILAALMGYLAVLYASLGSGLTAVIMGAAAGIGVLVGAGILTQIFVGLIWLVSKFPSMGRLSLRMAFRSMGTQRRRLGSTMLALCVGMLAVGSIAILAQNMRAFAQTGVSKELGLNVAVQSPHNPAAIRRITREVAQLPGVEKHDFGAVANGASLVSIDGKSAVATLQAKRKANKIDSTTVSTLAPEMQGIEGRNVAVARYNWTMTAGRNLDARDVGTNHIVMIEDVKTLGVKIGSRVVFEDGGHQIPFTVIGLARSSSFTLFGSNEIDLRYMQRVGLTTPSAAHFSVLYLNMRSDALQANLSTLRRHLQGILVLDLSNFTVMINKTIDKFVLFPEIIGALALFAGVIIIANTVALAMLERRREIGVVRAVGARRGTVLRFLLVENAIVGFLGALAGVLLAMVATAIVDQQLLRTGASYDWATVIGLVVMGVVLAMGASSLTALPASSEKPMTVLRYE